jgi:mRNA interferase MazF
MIPLKRGTIVDVDLDPTKGSETGKVRPAIVVTNNIYNDRVPVIQVVPITEWSDKKAKIKTNVSIAPSPLNGLTKRSIADCLQTRPIDRRVRLIGIRGQLETEIVAQIDEALRIVFDLSSSSLNSECD